MVNEYIDAIDYILKYDLQVSIIFKNLAKIYINKAKVKDCYNYSQDQKIWEFNVSRHDLINKIMDLKTGICP